MVGSALFVAAGGQKSYCRSTISSTSAAENLGNMSTLIAKPYAGVAMHANMVKYDLIWDGNISARMIWGTSPGVVNYVVQRSVMFTMYCMSTGSKWGSALTAAIP
ncbi:hypothetical protein BK653_14900 [Pseudomonas brassicacearum]|nr:hypothetical protein BK653_14900 [Pseudomonas brassicacearum]